MLVLRILALAGLMLLGSCSYTFDIETRLIDGQVTFVVAPDSRSKPGRSCVRTIMVGDDDGFVWQDHVTDPCGTRFPVVYGQPLRGAPDPDLADLKMAPRQLRPGITYQVMANAGIGYGEGRFRLTQDGRVESLP
ncbi:MAG: hypothetical protein IBJ02_03220 [Brevundimonas sp.]|nr:hypothetical protein [Brevundimonas sp.]